MPSFFSSDCGINQCQGPFQRQANTWREGLDSVMTFGSKFGFGSFFELSYGPILADVAAF